MMIKLSARLLYSLFLFCFFSHCFAGISVSPMVADFTPQNHYIDFSVENIGKEVDYVNVTISRVSKPGTSLRLSEVIFDPRKAGLLVTPNKLILPPKSMRTVRAQLTESPGESDKVYEITFSPVRSDVTQNVDTSDNKKVSASISITIAFAASVIVRPMNPHSKVTAQREKNVVTFTNQGNTAAQIKDVKQCKNKTECTKLSELTVYADSTRTLTLPEAAPITYTVGYYPARDEVATTN